MDGWNKRVINLMQRGTHAGTVAAPWRPLGSLGEAMSEYLLSTVTCPLSERQKICVKGRQAHIGQKTRVHGSLDTPGGKQRLTAGSMRAKGLSVRCSWEGVRMMQKCIC